MASSTAKPANYIEDGHYYQVRNSAFVQHIWCVVEIVTYYHANHLYCNMFHMIEPFEQRHATWVCHWIRARRDRRGRQGRRLKSVGDDRAGPTQQASACCPAELHDPEPSRRSTSTPTRRKCNQANRSAGLRHRPRRDSDDELHVAVVPNAIHLAADTGRVVTCPFIPGRLPEDAPSAAPMVPIGSSSAALGSHCTSSGRTVPSGCSTVTTIEVVRQPVERNCATECDSASMRHYDETAGYGAGSPLARCGESLRSSNRLVSLRGPVRPDEAASHAIKRIAVAARRGRRDRKRRWTPSPRQQNFSRCNCGIRIKCRN